MKYINSRLVIFSFLIVPVIASAQTDTAAVMKDTTAMKMDTASKAAVDTAVKKEMADTAVMAAIPMNCYKQWHDYFTELGAKPKIDRTTAELFGRKRRRNADLPHINVAANIDVRKNHKGAGEQPS